MMKLLQRFQGTRRRQRRIRTHFYLALITAVLMTAFYFLLPAVYDAFIPKGTRGAHSLSHSMLFRFSYGTAFVSLLFLCFSLALGTWNMLQSRRAVPVHVDLRRDAGFWAGILGIAHVCLGSFVHVRHILNNFYVASRIRPELRENFTRFVIANYFGLAALLILLLLLVLSNDWLLKRLGSRRWKSLQRWNYLCFGLLIVHSVLYWIVENRPLPLIGPTALIILLTIAAQIIGIFLYRRFVKSRPAPPGA